MIDIRDLISPPGNYTEADRYRDFRAVFAGDRGQRVLAGILTRCGLLRSAYQVEMTAEGPVTAAADADEIMRRAGEREVGLWLLGVLHTEPEPQVDDERDGNDG